MELVSGLLPLLGSVIIGGVLLRQFRHHVKVTSADVSLRLIETVRRDEFREAFKKIREDNITTSDDSSIRRILNHYEHVALFEKNGVLQYNDVLHQHGGNIKLLYDSTKVMKVFDEAKRKNPGFVYVNLDNLMIRIKHEID